MTNGDDFRWRAVALKHVYDVSSVYVSELFGPKQRTLRRWYALFLKKGIVNEHQPRQTNTRWPPSVLAAVEGYVQAHTTFYIEELREYVTKNYPVITMISTATICRVLNFDLNLSRKVLGFSMSIGRTANASNERHRSGANVLSSAIATPSAVTMMRMTSSSPRWRSTSVCANIVWGFVTGVLVASFTGGGPTTTACDGEVLSGAVNTRQHVHDGRGYAVDDTREIRYSMDVLEQTVVRVAPDPENASADRRGGG